MADAGCDGHGVGGIDYNEHGDDAQGQCEDPPTGNTTQNIYMYSIQTLRLLSY